MAILHKLFLLIASILSRLPFRLLYLKSDFLYYLLYYAIHYRKKVIYSNLKKAFPDKTQQEYRSIVKKFYRNLTDIFFEVIKLKTISAEQLQKRMIIKNPEVLHELAANNTSVLLTLGHFANWEWLGPLISSQFNFKVFGPAKPLNDSFFNNFMNLCRSRFGFEPIHYKQAYRILAQHKNMITASIMAADQSPVQSDQNYWANFLNQDTPFYLGIEKMAASLGFAVVYVDLKRIKRGFYQIEFQLLSPNAKNCSEHEIINKYIRSLEQSIINHPENWLWSHRRWKYKKPIQ